MKVKFCPAARVSGVLKPVMVNPVPVKVACEIVTLEPPGLAKLALWVLLLPT